MTRLATEVLVVGSGAGGATTAVALAEAGRNVTLVEEGPRYDPDAHHSFSIDELTALYRHRGSSAALGRPPIAYAEGRCVGGTTEINSGLWHRLPAELAEQWSRDHQIGDLEASSLDGYAERIESWLGMSGVPTAAPRSSSVLGRGAAELGWRSTELARTVQYDGRGRATRQTMARTLVPRAEAAGVSVIARCRVQKLRRSGDRIVGALCRLHREDGPDETLTIDADHAFVCGGAIQTPALLQRSGLRGRVGSGLKVHPTVKIAARFAHPLDHDEVPAHRVTEFAPDLAIGGSASRRGHVGLALADSGADTADVRRDWENVFVYYAAIRSDGAGRVRSLPGLASPIVTYRLTEADLSRLARGLVLLGELLLAAGARELYPSVTGAPIVRAPDDLARWWNAVDRARANLMTVHLTSTVRMGEDRDRSAADSFGAVHGVQNLRVNDASLLPDAPGVNPQAAIMSVALRNAEHFLSVT
jgi:choline dehydrogenase-like flavoprotein